METEEMPSVVDLLLDGETDMATLRKAAALQEAGIGGDGEGTSEDGQGHGTEGFVA